MADNGRVKPYGLADVLRTMNRESGWTWKGRGFKRVRKAIKRAIRRSAGVE